MNSTDYHVDPAKSYYEGLGARQALTLVLVAAFIIRCIIAFTDVNVFSGYEMFQELEQGHRLVFGSGVIPFEFIYGYRSWLIPGVVAAILKICSLISSEPAFYLAVLRSLAIATSLTAVACGHLIASRIAGKIWGVITAFVCAVWFQAIYFAPFLMPEVFAAYLTLIAIYLVSDPPPQPSARTSAIVGTLLGLAFCLRFQMAPALFLIAAWYCRTQWRSRWIPMAAAGLAIVLPILGLLDFLALGAPFQSVWLNFRENVSHGVASQFGSAPALYYFLDLSPSVHSMAIAVVLGWLAFMGGFRSPLLVLSALAMVIPQSFIAHKEYRFICYALLAMPILIGLGLSTVAQVATRHVGPRFSAILTAGILVVATGSSFYEFHRMAIYRYTQNAGTLNSFLAAHKYKELCGLGVADFPWHGTGGYTYLHRDVPVFFAYSLTGTNTPGSYGTDLHREIGLATRFVLKGKTLMQYRGKELFQNSQAYNFLVAREGRQVPGYRQVQCFSSGPPPLLSACLSERLGRCR